MSKLKPCDFGERMGMGFDPNCSACRAINPDQAPSVNVTAATSQQSRDFDVVAGGAKYPLIKPVVKTLLPTGDQERKDAPLARGLLDYFPRALVAVAALSKAANDKHNPGEPLHWSKDKSNDHADCLMRHLIERGTVDTDGQRHAVKVAWRALALLETELEAQS